MSSITGTPNASYGYDYSGRRSSKTVSGTATNYLYDGLNLVSEASGGTTTYHLFGPGIDEPLASSRGASVVYQAVDALGSVALTTNPVGATQNSYVFDAWGVSRSSSETFAQPFQYTAREAGEVANDLFYRARFHSSAVGRFLSEDPISRLDFMVGTEIIGPKLLSLLQHDPDINKAYLYVLNRPMDLVDPFGLCGDPPNRNAYRTCHQYAEAAGRWKECNLRRVRSGIRVAEIGLITLSMTFVAMETRSVLPPLAVGVGEGVLSLGINYAYDRYAQSSTEAYVRRVERGCEIDRQTQACLKH